MITVSIKTWLSLMSIDSMMASTVGTSSFWVITTRPLMRLSARTVTLSLLSSPAFDSPVRWLAGLRAWEVPRVTLPLAPALAFWF